MYELEPESEHTTQVARLTRILFDQARDLDIHLYSSEVSDLVEAAGLLHDIGWSRSARGKAHHKHSSDMIREQVWESLSDKEVDYVAQIARYHRKALPSEKHLPYHQLSKKERNMICAGAAFLRIGDALDRSHRQLIDSVKLRRGDTNETYVVEAVSSVECYPEHIGFEKKKDLFESYFGKVISLRTSLSS